MKCTGLGIVEPGIVVIFPWTNFASSPENSWATKAGNYDGWLD